MTAEPRVGDLLTWLADFVEAAAERGAARAIQPSPIVAAWLPASDIADRLSISAPTARQLLREAGIEPVKFGRVLRYPADQVEAWITRQAAGSSPDRSSSRARVVPLVAPPRLETERRRSPTGSKQKARSAR